MLSTVFLPTGHLYTVLGEYLFSSLAHFRIRSFVLVFVFWPLNCRSSLHMGVGADTGPTRASVRVTLSLYEEF